ncbi:MAG: 2-amino-4-hydroxy-6-hydroxymethyldihydropteridine diphosphokinase, partial [Bacteroidota bacterium]
TALPAAALMHRLLDIERKMGRERSERYGPRLIDIDILLFNDEIHLEADLKIPHPELPGRRFALLPLASVAARMLHPLTGKTIEALLSDCTDPGEVRAYP